MILNDSGARVLISQGIFQDQVEKTLISTPLIEKVIWTRRTTQPSKGSDAVEYEKMISKENLIQL